VIAGIWPEIDDESYWKTTGTAIIIAIAFAHAFLLALPDLDDRNKWVQKVTLVSIGVLSVLIIIAVWGETDSDSFLRVLAVVAIIVGLETLVVPILFKMRRGVEEKGRSLILERVAGDLYRDLEGKTYQVKEVESQPE